LKTEFPSTKLGSQLQRVAQIKQVQSCLGVSRAPATFYPATLGWPKT